jgi:hypothetical protein
MFSLLGRRLGVLGVVVVVVVVAAFFFCITSSSSLSYLFLRVKDGKE